MSSKAIDKAVQPVVMLTVGDRMLQLVFDFEAIAEAEDVCGRTILSGLSSKEIYHPPIRLVQATLYASLLKYQPQITWAEAKAFVTAKTMSDIWIKVIEAWNKAMVDPVTEEPPEGEVQGRS